MLQIPKSTVKSPYHVIRADVHKHRACIEGLWTRNLSVVPEDAGAKYNWQFLQNPYQQGYCWLVQAGDEPVGTVSVGPRLLHGGGKDVPVGVIGDFAIDKRHRIAQPALMLQRAAMSSLNDDMPMLYGLPNPLALPLMKRAGYKEAAPVHRYAKPLNVSSYLRRHPRTAMLPAWMLSTLDVLSATWERSARKFAGSSASASLIDEFDARFDDLWDRVKRRMPFAMGVRDSQFLRWRFASCPMREYKVMGLLAAGGKRLDGYLVFYVESDALMCRDLVVGSGADLRALIFDTATYARSIGLGSMSFACILTPELMAGLKSCQFRRRTADPAEANADPKVRARTLLVLERNGAALLKNGWYVTGSDEDND